jgi:uncharacterized protein related to proFAR isomerase
MEIVPLLYIKDRKIHAEKDGEPIALEEILTQLDKDQKIYVYDFDGIEKDNPNLCTFPKLSEHCKTWVDAGPRVLGDVVDTVMTGVSYLTVRKNLWLKLDISSIKDMTKRAVYFGLDLTRNDSYEKDLTVFQEADGYVVFDDNKQLKNDFKSEEFLKNLCNKHKVYVADSEGENVLLWKKLGATGALVDLARIKQVNI